MRRLRTTYVDDWEDIETADKPRVRLLGLSIHPLTAMVATLVAVVLLVLLSWAVNRGWVSDDPRVLWAIRGLSMLGLGIVVIIMVMSTWAMAKTLRNARMQLAKLDGATDEEARQETERFIRRNVYARMAAYALITLGVWVLLGSQLIFPWGGPFPFLGGVLVLAVLFLFYGMYQPRVWEALRRRAGRHG